MNYYWLLKVLMCFALCLINSNLARSNSLDSMRKKGYKDITIHEARSILDSTKGKRLYEYESITMSEIYDLDSGGVLVLPPFNSEKESGRFYQDRLTFLKEMGDILEQTSQNEGLDIRKDLKYDYFGLSQLDLLKLVNDTLKQRFDSFPTFDEIDSLIQNIDEDERSNPVIFSLISSMILTRIKLTSTISVEFILADKDKKELLVRDDSGGEFFFISECFHFLFKNEDEIPLKNWFR